MSDRHLVLAISGIYHRPQGIPELVDQVVTKVLDAARVPSDLIRRWKAPPDPA